jgi:phenylacetate-coenzyme A ligase PaaK-like adenylate-forming protein
MSSIVGSLVLRAADRSRSSNTLQLLRQVRGEPFVTPEAAAARQLERLQALLDHCERNVPFYRRRFAELGIRAADIRSLADYAALPPLTKADIAEHGEDMIATDRSLLAHHSGGSTGVPLRFYRDMAYVAASEAGTYRNLHAVRLAAGRDDRLLLGVERAPLGHGPPGVRAAAVRPADVPVRPVPLG